VFGRSATAKLSLHNPRAVPLQWLGGADAPAGGADLRPSKRTRFCTRGIGSRSGQVVGLIGRNEQRYVVGGEGAKLSASEIVSRRQLQTQSDDWIRQLVWQGPRDPRVCRSPFHLTTALGWAKAG
jgi:hypothetical protein